MKNVDFRITVAYQRILYCDTSAPSTTRLTELFLYPVFLGTDRRSIFRIVFCSTVKGGCNYTHYSHTASLTLGRLQQFLRSILTVGEIF